MNMKNKKNANVNNNVGNGSKFFPPKEETRRVVKQYQGPGLEDIFYAKSNVLTSNGSTSTKKYQNDFTPKGFHQMNNNQGSNQNNNDMQNNQGNAQPNFNFQNNGNVEQNNYQGNGGAQPLKYNANVYNNQNGYVDQNYNNQNMNQQYQGQSYNNYDQQYQGQQYQNQYQNQNQQYQDQQYQGQYQEQYIEQGNEEGYYDTRTENSGPRFFDMSLIDSIPEDAIMEKKDESEKDFVSVEEQLKAIRVDMLDGMDDNDEDQEEKTLEANVVEERKAIVKRYQIGEKEKTPEGKVVMTYSFNGPSSILAKDERNDSLVEDVYGDK